MEKTMDKAIITVEGKDTRRYYWQRYVLILLTMA